jgi:hypothetical protein
MRVPRGHCSMSRTQAILWVTFWASYAAFFVGLQWRRRRAERVAKVTARLLGKPAEPAVPEWKDSPAIPLHVMQQYKAMMAQMSAKSGASPQQLGRPRSFRIGPEAGLAEYTSTSGSTQAP